MKRVAEFLVKKVLFFEKQGIEGGVNRKDVGDFFADYCDSHKCSECCIRKECRDFNRKDSSPSVFDSIAAAIEKEAAEMQKSESARTLADIKPKGDL